MPVSLAACHKTHPIGNVILSRRLIKHQINCTCNCTPVQPPIRIHPQGLAIELLQVTWLLDRFEKTMETCPCQLSPSQHQLIVPPLMPMIVGLLQDQDGLRLDYLHSRNGHGELKLQNRRKNKRGGVNKQTRQNRPTPLAQVQTNPKRQPGQRRLECCSSFRPTRRRDASLFGKPCCHWSSPGGVDSRCHRPTILPAERNDEKRKKISRKQFEFIFRPSRSRW